MSSSWKPLLSFTIQRLLLLVLRFVKLFFQRVMHSQFYHFVAHTFRWGSVLFILYNIIRVAPTTAIEFGLSRSLLPHRHNSIV